MYRQLPQKTAMTYRNSPRTGIVLLVLAQGLAGCAGTGSSPAPTAPSTITQARPNYPTSAALSGVTLFGVVSEMTSTGQLPIEDVEVYCDSCGELRHTWTHTDGNGFYSFSGDLAHGGGVWVQAGFTNPLIRRGFSWAF